MSRNSKKVFPNTTWGQEILVHKKLPIFYLWEFDFYRIIEFKDDFYYKTVSEIHSNNLRKQKNKNRYSFLFNLGKISYWSSDVKTAKKEFKYHNKDKKNIIIFRSYDDYSSTYPITNIKEKLKIIDGRLYNFSNLIEKYEKNIKFSKSELETIKQIEQFKPDCIAYESKRNKGGYNFIFFENGFKKLVLRNVELILNGKSNNRNRITCAATSDYMPVLENYGLYFHPITKISFDENYLNSEEYINRKKEFEKTIAKFKRNV